LSPFLARNDARENPRSAARSRPCYNPASQIVTRTRDNDAYRTNYVSADRAYVANGLNQYSSVAGATYGYDANSLPRRRPGAT
jgi:hypothetical protein